MTVIRLKQQYKDAILNDSELQGKVAKACNKSLSTIYRWCKEDAQQLTMLSILNAVRDYLKLPKSEHLTEHVELTEATA